MARQPMKKPVAKMKTSAKPKANASKDYMKPVGGTKQEGYVKPGGNLFDIKADRKVDSRGLVKTRRTGRGVGQPKLGMRDIGGDVPTGVNPKAMKASSGNPKPTNAQMTAGKKASADAKARATARARAKAAADKAAKLKAAKTAKKPTTGVYKRNQG
jgi:hypothetical protein